LPLSARTSRRLAGASYGEAPQSERILLYRRSSSAKDLKRTDEKHRSPSDNKLISLPARRHTPQLAANNEPRAGSKQALVIGMLSSKAGVTLQTLIEAPG